MAALIQSLAHGLPFIVKWVMLATAAALLICIIAWPVRYQASSELFIGVAPQNGAVPTASTLLAPAEETAVVSELSALLSPTLISALADDLSLWTDPEFDIPHSGPLTWWAPAPPGQTDQMHRSRIVSTITDAMQAEHIPRSAVIRVTATTSDPNKSARMANRLVELYLGERRSTQRQLHTDRATWLTHQVAAAQSGVNEAKRALIAFRTETEMLSPEAVLLKEARFAELREMLDRSGPATGETQPFASSTAKRAELQGIKEELAAQIQTYHQQNLTFGGLEQRLVSAQALLDHYSVQLSLASDAATDPASDSRIMSRAMVSSDPSSPRIGLILAATAMVSLLVSTIWVLVRAISNQTFQTARQLARFSGYQSRVSSPTLHPLSSELLASSSGTTRIILVTSAVDEDGTRKLARDLVKAISNADASVLLIQAGTDIRRTGVSSDLIRTDTGLGADILNLPGLGTAPNLQFSDAEIASLLPKFKSTYQFVVLAVPALLTSMLSSDMARQIDATVLAVKRNRTRSDDLDAALVRLETAQIRIAGLVLTDTPPLHLRRTRLFDRFGAKADFHPGYGGV